MIAAECICTPKPAGSDECQCRLFWQMRSGTVGPIAGDDQRQEFGVLSLCAREVSIAVKTEKA